MSSNKLLISICIPTYNRFKFLNELLESIINSDYYNDSNFEIIVSQDRFKDFNYNREINDLCKKLSNSKRIKYNLTSENYGLAKNWNKCIEMANGKYCIILGDDDLFSDNALFKYLNLASSINADIIFSNHYLINENGIILKNSKDNSIKFNRGNLPSGYLSNPEKSIWQNAVPISTSLIKRELLKSEPFRENINTPEIEFFLRAWTKYQSSFYFTTDYLIKYRVHGQSATSSGLTIHKLFMWLKDIPATSQNYNYKKAFLNHLSVSSVNSFLKEGNIEAAKTIYYSDYYLDKSFIKYKSIVQKLLLHFPLLNRLVLK